MMKDVIIPNNKLKGFIDITNIDTDFKGIVIAYHIDKAVGYLTNDGDSWYYYTSINGLDENGEYNEYQEDSIVALCKKLINDKVATNFKVIEFE